MTYKSWALERESIEQRQLIEHESEKRHDIPKDQINLTVKGVGKSELDPVYSEADHWSGRRPHVVWLERSEGVSSGRGLMRWGDGYRECWNCERRLAMSWLEPETRGERLTPWANEIISEERRWSNRRPVWKIIKTITSGRAKRFLPPKVSKFGKMSCTYELWDRRRWPSR